MQRLLGLKPKDLKLYEKAFSHRSAAKVLPGGTKDSNERLEFLGDAVLGVVIAEMLYLKFPLKDEGFLTDMRSKIVNRSHLNELSKRVGIDTLLLYDHRRVNATTVHQSLFGNAFEAVIGAIYLDRGYSTVKRFILKVMKQHVDMRGLELSVNYKSKLIEWGQRNGRDVLFKLTFHPLSAGELFSVKVLIDGVAYGEGQDYSKKGAEKFAAEQACRSLQI